MCFHGKYFKGSCICDQTEISTFVLKRLFLQKTYHDGNTRVQFEIPQFKHQNPRGNQTVPYLSKSHNFSSELLYL